ncbi:hypothetical protein P7K49_026757 [Saguinus oedipus]|uniref:Uncharacterized protein n=1 Tax=Saguinus oedipus TaxID=9490 RepID=A0ABQ9UED5_SAGOE|nr:hypothetical protein P7K49_026757 [Saguinus oedipus]
MDPDCWLFGGEFEDSVFEERPERQSGPPAFYCAKRCEPQASLSAGPRPRPLRPRERKPRRVPTPAASPVVSPFMEEAAFPGPNPRIVTCLTPLP